jgi:hypothetical protein
MPTCLLFIIKNPSVIHATCKVDFFLNFSHLIHHILLLLSERSANDTFIFILISMSYFLLPHEFPSDV